VNLKGTGVGALALGGDEEIEVDAHRDGHDRLQIQHWLERQRTIHKIRHGELA